MKAYAAQQDCSTAERNRLIAEHVDVARRIATRMSRRCPPWVTREDLIAAANVGLTEAAHRFDATRNEPFLAFAEKRIRGAVLDELRRGDIMPRRLRTLARKVGSTINALERELGAPPSDEAVADALGVSVDEYRRELEGLVHATTGALDRLDEAIAVTDEEESPAAAAARLEAIRHIRAVLPRLGERDLLILGLYYNEELTYHEIAQLLAITTSRVCQLHARAIARVRTEIESAAMQEAA